MFRTYVASFLLTLLALFTSCCKEGYELVRYSFSDQDKAFCPYVGSQKITFTHSRGYEFSLNSNASELKTTQVGPESCEDNYYSFDSQVIILESSVPELLIEFNLYPSSYSSAVNIKVNRALFTIDKKSPPNFEKLTIEGKEYKNVYVANHTEKENVTIFPTKIYYNAQYGVIQIKMTNDDTFTIKN